MTAPEQCADLQRAIVAYAALMDALVPESQYYRGERQDDDKVAAYSATIQGAVARRRERERMAVAPDDRRTSMPIACQDLDADGNPCGICPACVLAKQPKPSK